MFSVQTWMFENKKKVLSPKFWLESVEMFKKCFYFHSEALEFASCRYQIFFPEIKHAGQV